MLVAFIVRRYRFDDDVEEAALLGLSIGIISIVLFVSLYSEADQHQFDWRCGVGTWSKKNILRLLFTIKYCSDIALT